MCLPVKVRILAQCTIDLREVVGHQRAVLRHRTTRVDKSQQQRFAAVVANVNLAIVLIAKREIRNLITLFRHQGGRNRRGLSTRVGHDQIFKPGVRAIDDKRGSESIVRSEFLEINLVTHREWHRHPGHIAFDVPVRDGHLVLVGVDRHDLARQFETSLVAPPAGRTQTHAHG